MRDTAGNYFCLHSIQYETKMCLPRSSRWLTPGFAHVVTHSPVLSLSFVADKELGVSALAENADPGARGPAVPKISCYSWYV